MGLRRHRWHRYLQTRFARQLCSSGAGKGIYDLEDHRGLMAAKTLSLGPFRPTPIRRALEAVESLLPSHDSTAEVVTFHSRNWNQIENWCTLCKEPLNSWNEHRGKREHICLELLFDRIVNDPARCWEPTDVLNYQRYFTNLAVTSFYDTYDSSDNERRTEIVGLMKYLMDREMLFPSPRKQSSPSCVFSKHPVNFWGYVVLNKVLFQPLTFIFPTAEAKDLAAMTQMTSGSFNLESVFELLNLRSFVTVADFVSAKADKNSMPSDFTFSQKSACVRNILGQLRWSVEPDSAPCPFPNPAPYNVIICQRLLKMMAAELVSCRMSEYTARIEPVLREQRASWSRAPPPGAELPLLYVSNKGAMSLYDYKLHSTEYRAMLASDPTTITRRNVKYLSELQRSRK